MLGWYVAKTKPRREVATVAVLDARGFETYFPRFAPRRNRPRDLEPLFPGYLFVKLDPETPRWLEVRSAPGVAYFLGSPAAMGRELPTAVPDELIAEIRTRVSEQASAARGEAFRPGERLVIVGGPLDGLEAVFAGSLSASGRSRVLVEIVSRLVPVSVESGRLSRLAPAV